MRAYECRSCWHYARKVEVRVITRIVVYTSLLCMILLTAYQYHNRRTVRQNSLEVAAPVTTPTTPPRKMAQATPENKQTGALHGSLSPERSYSPPAVPATTPSPDSRDKRIEKEAITLFNNKDYKGALNLLREVENPDTEVLLGTGLCYFKLHDYENSLSFLQQVLGRDRNNFDALKVSAFAYYYLDNLDKSFDDARKGLAVRNDRELQALYDRLGRERKSRQGYIEEDSSHFRILYNGYKQGNVDRKILGILEDAYRTIGQDLDYFPSEPVTVILYTDRAFYDTTLAPHWSAGLYDGKIRIPVKGVDVNEPVVRKVLFHEYTHVLVHYIAHSCPLWINEGLAEYFSTSYPKKIGQLIPLQSMEKSFSGFSDRNVAIAYMESYSAVSSLVDRYGLYRVKTMLEGFGAGKGADDAFEDAFDITYSGFISRWGKGGNSSF